jgi:hypothetical protein
MELAKGQFVPGLIVKQEVLLCVMARYPVA